MISVAQHDRPQTAGDSDSRSSFARPLMSPRFRGKQSMSARIWLLGLCARLILTVTYRLVLLMARLGRRMAPRRWRPTGRIVVTGTFYNTNWYLSHMRPLSTSGVEEVFVVADQPQPEIDGVRVVCPPDWLTRLLGRTVSKLLWMVGIGVRQKPDLFMGYHLFPGACSALVAAKLCGRPACYQMTGGPIEIIGGGNRNENRVMSKLVRPSAFLEEAAMSVAREFELAVVRGERAKRFLRSRGYGGSVAVITGSVDPPPHWRNGSRLFDMAFVGRLAEIKQPDQFIEVVAAVRQSVPDVRAAIAGDGPMREYLRRQAEKLGIERQIEFLGKRDDVPRLLARSKTFVLTSRSEGLSIAMAEAMAAGAVPVVADVGELDQLVVDGVNGYLVEPNDTRRLADRIVLLLSDPAAWARCSQQAREAAVRCCAIDAVAERWGDALSSAIARASRPEEGAGDSL